MGRLVEVEDTRLWVEERGDPGAFPLLVFHGGPGLDHHMFGDYLDPLGDRYRLLFVDERAQGRSEPAPEDHMIGNDPMRIARTVIILGRTRCTAP